MKLKVKLSLFSAKLQSDLHFRHEFEGLYDDYEIIPAKFVMIMKLFLLFFMIHAEKEHLKLQFLHGFEYKHTEL